MKVNIRFACCEEYLGKTENGCYNIPDNCTIGEALDHLQTVFDRKFSENLTEYLTFVVNGKIARQDKVLSPGDSLIVLRIIFGG